MKVKSSFFKNNFDWHVKQNSRLSHMVCKQRGDGAVYCGNKAENSHMVCKQRGDGAVYCGNKAENSH